MTRISDGVKIAMITSKLTHIVMSEKGHGHYIPICNTSKQQCYDVLGFIYSLLEGSIEKERMKKIKKMMEPTPFFHEIAESVKNEFFSEIEGKGIETSNIIPKEPF